VQWIFDQFDLPASGHILELGCGTGKLWQNNLGRIPQEWSITLSDFSAGMTRRARLNLTGQQRAFFVTRADAQNIPFEDERFDAVVANHMLYHVPDLEQALSEIQRVLKPRGRLYAATNGQNHMKELDDLVRGYLPHAPAREVISTFTLENGKRSLERFFSAVELRKQESDLLVTEVSPLVAYSLSRIGIFADGSQIGQDKEATFRQHIEAQMRAQDGAIRITKDTGLFIAVKEPAEKSRR